MQLHTEGKSFRHFLVELHPIRRVHNSHPMFIEKGGGIIAWDYELLLCTNRTSLETTNLSATIVQLIAVIIAMPHRTSILDVDLISQGASCHMLSKIHLGLIPAPQSFVASARVP